MQAKVPEISVVAVWAGPPLDDAEKAWESDQRVKDLIPRLAPRRVPIEDAQKIIADFIVGNADEREQKGTLLFAGLFERLNRERTEIMNGHRAAGPPPEGTRGKNPLRYFGTAQIAGHRQSG